MTLALVGELDVATPERLRGELEPLEVSGTRLVSGLRRLPFLDSIGVTELVRARTRAEANSQVLEILAGDGLARQRRTRWGWRTTCTRDGPAAGSDRRALEGCDAASARILSRHPTRWPMEDKDATGTPPPHDPASWSDVHTRRLPVVARSVGAARHWLAERPLRGVSLRNAQLVLSELVTNAIIHAGLDEARDEIEVTLRPTPSGVRIEVRDRGPGFAPPPADAGRGATLAGGHGLTIVGRLVDRWGVDRTRGTCVWFEMDRR